MPDNVDALRAAGAGFEPWYRFFPWEDWRDGRPEILDDGRSCRAASNGRTTGSDDATARSAAASGCGSASASAAAAWDEEKVLDRYELLYEAGLVEEAKRDGREAALARRAARTRRADALRPPPHPRHRASRGCAPS